MSEQAVVEPEHRVVEGTATELVPVHAAGPAPLFPGAEPSDVVAKATDVADALADVIAKKRLFVNVQGKSHVLVEGWQLLGTMLGVTAVCTHTEGVPGGFKATVEARTADGRVVGRADAMCTKDEKRGPWKSADDYARLSMAQTRATSKALKGPLGFIVSLAGYEGTPAEEMTFAEQERPAETVLPNPPTNGPPSDAISEDTAKILLSVAQASSVPSGAVTAWLKAHGGSIRKLTPATAEEFSLWLEQQSSDVPADTEGLAA